MKIANRLREPFTAPFVLNFSVLLFWRRGRSTVAAGVRAAHPNESENGQLGLRSAGRSTNLSLEPFYLGRGG